MAMPTDEQIKVAATIIKVLQLVRKPGMDTISVKLNCQPTHEEELHAKMWALAFNVVQNCDHIPTVGMETFEVALKLAEEIKKLR